MQIQTRVNVRPVDDVLIYKTLFLKENAFTIKSSRDII